MKKLFFYAIFLYSCPTILHSLPDWTIFNYIEADNNVCAFGLNNVKAMQKVGSTKNVNVVVQLDEIYHKKTWRFKVAQGGNIEDASLNQDMGINPEKELPEGVLWASHKYPSTYFMLLLWNHGNGILDEPKGYKKPYRGILYDYANNTYLNNQQLENALSVIHHQVLGKKIDLLGMDACLMSMLEVCYQVKDHASLLVASENVEPAPGWDYASFLGQLTKQLYKIEPQKLAEMIVTSYGNFTKSRGKYYTLSGINLDEIDLIVKNLSSIVYGLNKYASQDRAYVKEIVKTARKTAVDFYDGKYVDLACFYKQLTNAILKKQFEEKDKPIKRNANELITLLSHGDSLIKKAVFSYSGKKTLAECGGLSIYYPRLTPLHHSYPLTKFAQNSPWLAFIKEYPAN